MDMSFQIVDALSRRIQVMAEVDRPDGDGVCRWTAQYTRGGKIVGQLRGSAVSIADVPAAVQAAFLKTEGIRRA